MDSPPEYPDRHVASLNRVDHTNTRLQQAIERAVAAEMALAATEAAVIAAALGVTADPGAQRLGDAVQAGATAFQVTVDHLQQQADAAQRIADAVQAGATAIQATVDQVQRQADAAQHGADAVQQQIDARSAPPPRAAPD